MKAKTVDSYAELAPVFIGREQEIKYFERYRQNFLEHYPHNSIHVVNYYGIGGIGKTSLLNHLQDTLVERGNRYYLVDLKNNTNPAEILKTASLSLAKAYNFEFPKFDLALLAYMRRTLAPINHAEIETFIGGSKLLSLLFDASSFIPDANLALATSIIKLADSTIAYVRNVFGSDPNAAVKKIDNLSTEEILRRLPAFFAADMRENIKKSDDPFFFLIDTFENLVDEAETKGHSAYYDDWLRGEEGLIQNMPNCLWVIAGRESLKWAQEDGDWRRAITAYKLHNFTREETITLLNTQNIADEEIENGVYDLTEGTPFYVNACVRRYYNLLDRGETITISKFGNNKDELMERYARDYDLQTKQIIYVLSFIQPFTESIAETILPAIIPDYTRERLKTLLNLSIVTRRNNTYAIQNTVANIFAANCPADFHDKIITEAAAYFVANDRIINLLNLFSDEIKRNREKQSTVLHLADSIDEYLSQIAIYAHNHLLNSIGENYFRSHPIYQMLPFPLIFRKYFETAEYEKIFPNTSKRIVEERYKKYKFIAEYTTNTCSQKLLEYLESLCPEPDETVDYYRALIGANALINTNNHPLSKSLDRAWNDISDEKSRFNVIKDVEGLNNPELESYFKNLRPSKITNLQDRFSCAAFLALFFAGYRYTLNDVDKAFIDYQLSAQNLRTCQTLLLQDKIKPNANDYATYILAEIYNHEHAGDSKESIKQFTAKAINNLKQCPKYSRRTIAHLVKAFKLIDRGYMDHSVGHLHVRLIDDSPEHNPVAGGSIGLYGPNRRLITEVKLRKSNEFDVDVPVLYLGEYYLKQETAPIYYKNAHYIINDTAYKFVFNADSIDYNIELVTYRPKGAIAFELTDQNKLPLPDQRLHIYDADGNFIIESTTNDSGQVGIKNLPLGKYYYQFPTATDSEKHTFELTVAGETITNRIVDNNLTGNPLHESPKPKKKGLFRHKK